MSVADQIRWVKHHVLDAGFVALVDVMGSDEDIVQAARVSYGKGTRSVSDDRTLIRYLMRHKHSTPFEMCLDGDTRIPTMPCFGATQKTYTIRQLSSAFETGGKANSWAKLVRIRTVDPETGLITAAKIRRAWKTGDSMCYRVQSSSPLGCTVITTETHPFLCEDGRYRPLADLRDGTSVMMNGKGIPHAFASRIVELRQKGRSIGDIAEELGCTSSGVYGRLPRELRGRVPRKTGFLKKPIGQHADPRAIARRLIAIDGPCAICGQPAAERHHRDENPHNNDPTNVVLLCVICHNAFHHGTTPIRTYASRIKSIEPIGVREVFDLEVDHPNHNFVAEHFVVHNCEIKLILRMPMDCWRQMVRHRAASVWGEASMWDEPSVNEYSTRYSEAIDARQVTAPTAWRLQSATNKQGSGGTVGEWTKEWEALTKAVPPPCSAGEYLSGDEGSLHRNADRVYRERLALGVAREQARKDLPLSTFTEAYWKCDLRNILHFLGLRMDSHAQWEIRQYANIIGNEIVAKLFPMTWEAFQDYSLNAITFSAPELAHLRYALSKVRPFLKSYDGLSARESDEFNAKIARILDES